MPGLVMALRQPLTDGTLFGLILNFGPSSGPDGEARLRSCSSEWKRSNGRKTNGAQGGSDCDLHRARFVVARLDLPRQRPLRFPPLRRSGLRPAEAVFGL